MSINLRINESMTNRFICTRPITKSCQLAQESIGLSPKSQLKLQKYIAFYN